jgi:hypothetical protein
MSDVTGVPRDAVVIHPPWEFYAGDDWPIAVEVHDADGTDIDLHTVTSCTWTLAKINADGTIAQLKSYGLGTGISIDGEQSNLAIVIVPRADTADWGGYTCFDEMIVTTGDDLRAHQYRGRINVIAPL